MRIWLLLLSLLAGVVCGRWWLSPQTVEGMDRVASAALKLLVLCVGLEIGADTGREMLRRLRSYGWKALLIPLGSIAGTVGGGVLFGLAAGYSPAVSGAVSTGMGWYSLSALLIREQLGGILGNIGFLCNLFRELLAFLLAPLLLRWGYGVCAVSVGGANGSDTLLPLFLRKGAGEEAALAVISGVLCTSAVPLLVPLFLRFAVG